MKRLSLNTTRCDVGEASEDFTQANANSVYFERSAEVRLAAWRPIGWEQSNRGYIMTHGVSGIDWKHYKHPLPENVYSTYMRYWGNVKLAG